MRLSGLQKEVLALYRQCLRESRKKPQETRLHFERFARAEFARNLSIDKRDFAAIEYLLRKGRRQLDVYSSPGIKDVRSVLDLSQPSNPRAIAFRRSRPRSRVVVISQRPSRVQRRNRYTVASTSPRPYEEDGTQTDGIGQDAGQTTSISLPSDMLDQYPRGLSLADELVSPLNSEASSVHEQSEASVDLDSFPMPPNHTGGWPLPDNKTLASSSNQPQMKEGVPKSGSMSLPKSATGNQRPVALSPPRRSKHASSSRNHRNPPRNPKPHEEGSVDPVLIEAISRSVADQLRLFSLSSRTPSPKKSRKPSTESRTPSQRQALDRFTRGLQQYADKVEAEGKVPAFTPTPCLSPATLRTVSALVPYRPEFRAAGLAVTSRDQAEKGPRIERNLEKLHTDRKERVPPGIQQGHVSRIDGKEDSPTNDSTVIDFIGSKDTDSWRRALIDEMPAIPPRKHSLVPGNPRPTPSRCFPCFSRKQDQSTMSDNVEGSKNTRSRPTRATQNVVSTSKQSRASTIQGRQGKWGPPLAEPDSLPPSPKHISRNLELRRKGRSAAALPSRHPRRPTGLRRRSMTLDQMVNPHPNCAVDRKRRGPPRDRPPNPHRPQRKLRLQKPSTIEAPLDLIPQASSNLDLHRFAERHFQSLPTHPIGSTFPGKDHGIETPPSMSNMPKMRKCTADTLPKSASTTRGALREDTHPVSKAALAKQEIARHDLGPYPTGVPKPRGTRPTSNLAPDIPRRSSSFRSPVRPSQASRDGQEINDRDVLKGLHVATAAAYDEVTARLVHEKTGVHIRRFLADLTAFESLASSQTGQGPEQWTRGRRSQMRKLKQHVRMSRQLRRKSGLFT